MRSTEPIPGNPWPHDMTITVEDDQSTLLDLLWIREAWNLQPTGDDLPPRLTNAPAPAPAHPESDDPERLARWTDAWPEMWGACLRHAGQIQDGRMFAQLSDTADGSAERKDLLQRLMGPTWRDQLGDEAFTSRYQAWVEDGFDSAVARHRQPLVEQPERVSLDALVSAWHTGLAKVVVIACVGSHTRLIGDRALLVTAETRNDQRRYTSALNEFAVHGG